MPDLRQLAFLDISHNLLRRLPSALLQLPQLTVLRATDLQLDALPREVRHSLLLLYTSILLRLSPVPTRLACALHCRTTATATGRYCPHRYPSWQLGSLTQLLQLDVSRNELSELPTSLANLQVIQAGVVVRT